jgi:ribosomal protein L37AE/L43A
MRKNIMDKLICPLCDKTITGFPALSRKDNSTYICSACGTAEAMEDYFRYLVKHRDVNTNNEYK